MEHHTRAALEASVAKSWRVVGTARDIAIAIGQEGVADDLFMLQIELARIQSSLLKKNPRARSLTNQTNVYDFL